uniref:Uncharacterized protein n=1 Tax=Sphaerodactylus townsendi TaxID=933632 RepID=A0ACB8FI82_9SAUR
MPGFSTLWPPPMAWLQHEKTAWAAAEPADKLPAVQRSQALPGQSSCASASCCQRKGPSPARVVPGSFAPQLPPLAQPASQAAVNLANELAASRSSQVSPGQSSHTTAGMGSPLMPLSLPDPARQAPLPPAKVFMF